MIHRRTMFADLEIPGNLFSEGSPYTFMGLPSDAEAFKSARVVILPVPYDGTTTFVPGTREGPRAIIMASRELEPYDEETETEPWRQGIFTLPELPVKISSPREMVERVKQAGLFILKHGKIPIMLGGEHLMTLGLVSSLKEFYSSENITVLHLDAHADLREEYQGSPWSNACVARRILELYPLVSVGIRSLTREEHDLVRRKAIPFYPAAQLHEKPALWNSIVENLSDNVYITIDLDVFDPSVMPSVGTPEPGGLGWYEVTGLLKQICLKRNVLGCDIMELKPIPGMVAPDFLAAKLVYKLCAYLYRRKGDLRPLDKDLTNC
ncbi:agmatinase [Thermodesulforhabdus norvegica]|uniref:Agmatinase n=1 Tax=Thermodesulforhabdus norvegica TaxID=39841 RepID=A0A1I4UWH0_9BACT|nr:agmatinase [Thermodesulforhabdus norvegica]SFM93291.1 agmatinase [Thermodesulforhabdus norvegica]